MKAYISNLHQICLSILLSIYACIYVSTNSIIYCISIYVSSIYVFSMHVYMYLSIIYVSIIHLSSMDVCMHHPSVIYHLYIHIIYKYYIAIISLSVI